VKSRCLHPCRQIPDSKSRPLRKALPANPLSIFSLFIILPYRVSLTATVGHSGHLNRLQNPTSSLQQPYFILQTICHANRAIESTFLLLAGAALCALNLFPREALLRLPLLTISPGAVLCAITLIRRMRRTPPTKYSKTRSRNHNRNHGLHRLHGFSFYIFLFIRAIRSLLSSRHPE